MPNTSHYHPAHHSVPYERQSFHHPHTSLGAAGHWVKTAGILSPLLIAEFVKDPERKWRYVRLASIGTALVSEALWTHRIHKEREAAQERCASVPEH